MRGDALCAVFLNELEKEFLNAYVVSSVCLHGYSVICIVSFHVRLFIEINIII